MQFISQCLLAAIACSFLVNSAAAQASYAQPRYDIGNIFFVDSMHGWAVGNQGGHSILFRTEDGGDVWTQITLPSVLYRVSFLDANLGWGISVDSSKETPRLCLYKTRDGGDTWSYVSTLSSSKPNQLDIITDFRFVDPEHGWFVGETSIGAGLALQTSDGGKSVQEVRGISKKNSLSRVYAVGKEKLWIFGKNTIVVSFDGGRTWKSQFDEDHLIGDYHSISLTSGVILSNGRGWAAGAGPVILRTTDFGNTWRVALERNEDWFTDISFWDVNVGCAVGASTRIDCTLDGGKSWTSLHVLLSKEVQGHDLYKRILFTSANRCWALSEGGWLFRSDDAGHSWHEVAF